MYTWNFLYCFEMHYRCLDKAGASPKSLSNKLPTSIVQANLGINLFKILAFLFYKNKETIPWDCCSSYFVGKLPHCLVLPLKYKYSFIFKVFGIRHCEGMQSKLEEVCMQVKLSYNVCQSSNVCQSRKLTTFIVCVHIYMCVYLHVYMCACIHAWYDCEIVFFHSSLVLEAT